MYTLYYDANPKMKELKVFTEEELVEKALKEEFEDFPGIAESSQVVEHADEEMRKDSCITGEEVICSGNSAIACSISGSCVSLDEPSTVTCNTVVPEEKTQKKKKKRGRSFDRNNRSGELEGSYFAKVNQLAKIKQKQDDAKLVARLHSFSGESRINEGTITTSDKIERLNSLRSITNPEKAKSLDSQEGMPVCYPEVVLCIEVYHNERFQKNQEFLVLGNQILTDLRDNIYCLTDRLMKISGEHDPSGYFFIENTFCNDLRDPLAIDYSKPIFDWLKNSKNEAAEKWECITSAELKKKQKDLLKGVEISNLPNLKAVDMHRTRFCDLQFRLGAGYLYCHQGNCKHSLVIRDIRLIHPEDAQKQAAYPLLTFKLQFRPRKCSVCLIYLAEKMTVDDKWAPKNPCYFCKDCYFLQHYKEDGSLMYPHLVFDYHHE